MALRSLPPWLLALPACMVPPPALPMAHESLPYPALSLLLVSIPRCLGTAQGHPGRKHCLCCSGPQLLTCTVLPAPWHICGFSFILNQQQDVGGTSDPAAADCGDKDLGAMNYVLTDAAAQRLLGLKSSGA